MSTKNIILIYNDIVVSTNPIGAVIFTYSLGLSRNSLVTSTESTFSSRAKLGQGSFHTARKQLCYHH